MKNNARQPKYDVTRYLCAAAELNRSFRNTVFEEIVHNSYRFVARSYGVDLSRVVRQCLRAQTRDLLLDLVLSVLMVIAVISNFVSNGFFPGLFMLIPTLLTWPLLLAFVTICGSKLYSYRVVASHLSRDNFHKEEAKETVVEIMYADRLKELKQLEDGNAVYYSGYSPFVGAGKRLGGWSFVFSTQSKEDEEKFIDLSLTHMYAYMESKLSKLQIDGMTITDCLFVDGKTVRQQPEFLPNELAAPLSTVSEATMQSCMDSFFEQKRYYKVVQISGWQGNLIFSSFFRVTQNDRQTFVEVSYYALPPLRNSYYAIDRLKSGIPLSFIGTSMLKSIFPAIMSPIQSPVRLISLLRQLLSKQSGAKREVKEIKENPAFDYGADQSLREMVASEKLNNYFQDADVDMYRKQIERQLMEGMTDYLESQGVDVSEFNRHTEAVVQQGITINAASFAVENMVSGNQIQNNFMNKVQSVLSTN